MAASFMDRYTSSFTTPNEPLLYSDTNAGTADYQGTMFFPSSLVHNGQLYTLFIQTTVVDPGFDDVNHYMEVHRNGTLLFQTTIPGNGQPLVEGRFLSDYGEVAGATFVVINGNVYVFVVTGDPVRARLFNIDGDRIGNVVNTNETDGYGNIASFAQLRFYVEGTSVFVRMREEPYEATSILHFELSDQTGIESTTFDTFPANVKPLGRYNGKWVGYDAIADKVQLVTSTTIEDMLNLNIPGYAIDAVITNTYMFIIADPADGNDPEVHIINLVDSSLVSSVSLVNVDSMWYYNDSFSIMFATDDTVVVPSTDDKIYVYSFDGTNLTETEQISTQGFFGEGKSVQRASFPVYVDLASNVMAYMTMTRDEEENGPGVDDKMFMQAVFLYGPPPPVVSTDTRTAVGSRQALAQRASRVTATRSRASRYALI